MSTRQKSWAKKSRQKMMTLLGARCNACGSQENLEFDCRKPTGHNSKGRSTDQKASFYRRELRRGNLQILCDRCNKLKGDRSMEHLMERLTTLLGSSTPSSSIRHCELCEQQRLTRSPRGELAFLPCTTLSTSGVQL